MSRSSFSRRRWLRRFSSRSSFAALFISGLVLVGSYALSTPTVRCNSELFCFAANQPALADQVNANFALVMDRAVPIGAILMWSGSTPPAGWVLCNGQTVARSDGTGNITAPDLRSRFVVGAGMGASLSTYAIGATGGAESVTLSTAQLPAHSHGVNDPGHNHVALPNIWNGNYLGNGSGRYSGGGSDPVGIGGTAFSTGSSGTGISIASTGSGASVPTLPPYYALSYIMKN